MGERIKNSTSETQRNIWNRVQEKRKEVKKREGKIRAEGRREEMGKEESSYKKNAALIELPVRQGKGREKKLPFGIKLFNT